MTSRADHADLVVVRGGVVGLATAYRLLEAPAATASLAIGRELAATAVGQFGL